MSYCNHEKRMTMFYRTEHICLECAAALYEAGDTAFMPAWLIVHGRQLDFVTELPPRPRFKATA